MRKLSRNEMKKVMGGLDEGEGTGTCCWHTADWSESGCNISKAEAQSAGAMWCCASCVKSQEEAGV